MKKIILIIISLLFLVTGLWFIAIPESLIINLIEGSLSKGSLSLKTEGFRKGLFYNFSIERVSLIGARDKNPGEPILTFHDINARMSMMSLLKLKPALDFNCTSGGGRISGTIRLDKGNLITVDGNDIKAGEVPFLKRIGISGEGDLSGSLWYSNKQGEAKFSVAGARFEDLSQGGVFLPLSIFHDIKGVISINGEAINVQSLTMNGNGAYARLRGGIKGNDLDGNLELMTDSSFKHGPFLEGMLETFRVSPGYYVIPVRGLLLNSVTETNKR